MKLWLLFMKSLLCMTIFCFSNCAKKEYYISKNPLICLGIDLGKVKYL